MSDAQAQQSAHPSRGLQFGELQGRSPLYLYAGDLPPGELYKKFIGLSLSQSNANHIRHDVTQKLPLGDCCVDLYQSEDVFDHIELQQLPAVIEEIYRVLKPGGLFRLSLPDYHCDMLQQRSLKSKTGQLLFDPQGGGGFVEGRVVNGGHVWFPTYTSVKRLLHSSPFIDIRFYHYYDETGQGVTHPIDYSIGHVMRTPDHDERVQNPYRPLSLVVDCVKL
jgi:SAM-dependent methyltransferase